MRIVITGASRGIGRVLADQYRQAGHDVLGTCRGAVPDGSDMMQHDVTRPDDHAALARRLDGEPLDLLVCNAGVFLEKGQNVADGFPPEMWAETFAVNVTGVFLGVQTLLPNLQAANDAKVAIISSRMGSDAEAAGGSYIYRASKAAALNLGRNLAVDLRGLGIAVGVYTPGWVRTDMGGTNADLDVDTSAAGLIKRFTALSLDNTGCFETWDGRQQEF